MLNVLWGGTYDTWDVTNMRVRGISEKNRRLLSILYRETSKPFTPKEASKLLSLTIDRTRRFLVYLVDMEWLARVRRGLYTTVPMDAAVPSKWREDPWVIASVLFSPCYIGGWSACEHWNLTDQIFRETVVITSRQIRHRQTAIGGASFRVKVVGDKKIFGTSVVWRGQARILISNPSKTIVDILDDPNIGGGIRHIAEVLNTYFESDHRKDEQLIEYINDLGNRSVFKRLGYLVEKLDIHAPMLINTCREKSSAGVVSLEPAAPRKGKITRRWNLRINVTI